MIGQLKIMTRVGVFGKERSFLIAAINTEMLSFMDGLGETELDIQNLTAAFHVLYRLRTSSFFPTR